MPYDADDFETIRASIEELNRDRVDRHVDRRSSGIRPNLSAHRSVLHGVLLRLTAMEGRRAEGKLMC